MKLGCQKDFQAKIQELHNELDTVWPMGRDPVCLPNDGPHYTLKGFTRPVSIGRVEAYLLYNVVRLFSARRGCEIGTGFGYSSFWLGGAVQSLGMGGFLATIDNLSEGGLGHSGLEFAKKWVRKFELSSIVNFYTGSSPAILGDLDLGALDFVLIDGNHHGNQPTDDYLGLREFLRHDSLILWHDVQAKYSVNRGISAATQDGWSTITFPTSCRLSISYRTMRGWDAALAAYSMARKLELDK